jgi:hypothetical protein
LKIVDFPESPAPWSRKIDHIIKKNKKKRENVLATKVEIAMSLRVFPWEGGGGQRESHCEWKEREKRKKCATRWRAITFRQ